MALRPSDDYHFTRISADSMAIPNNAISSVAAIPDGILTKAKHALVSYSPFTSAVTDWRVWDTGALLPTSAGGADDLYLDVGTWATDGIVVKSNDANGTTVTQYALFSFVMPHAYEDNEDVKIRIPAKLGVDADGAKTIDLVVYEDDCNGGIGSDLCTTSAITLTTSWADCDFAITDAGLTAGDVLICRVAISVTDSGSGAGIVANLGHARLMCDTRG